MSDDRTSHWEAVRARVDDSPYYRLLGLRVEELRAGYARLRVPVGDRFHQLHGVVHGGIAAGVADSCIGVALLTLTAPGQRSATVEMKINYLAAVEQGELVGEGRIVHKGRTLALGDADVCDQDGCLVAKAMATYMILPPPTPSA